MVILAIQSTVSLSTHPIASAVKSRQVLDIRYQKNGRQLMDFISGTKAGINSLTRITHLVILFGRMMDMYVWLSESVR